MSDTTEKRYLAHLGARIFSEANDLKRPPEALVAEIDVNLNTTHAVINR